MSCVKENKTLHKCNLLSITGLLKNRFPGTSLRPGPWPWAGFKQCAIMMQYSQCVSVEYYKSMCFIINIRFNTYGIEMLTQLCFV